MSTYDGRKPEPPYPTPDDIESLRDDIESLRDDIESLREAAKLSEARGRVCEAVEGLAQEWTPKHVMNTPLDLMVVKTIVALQDYKAALAAAEKGSA